MAPSWGGAQNEDSLQFWWWVETTEVWAEVRDGFLVDGASRLTDFS